MYRESIVVPCSIIRGGTRIGQPYGPMEVVVEMVNGVILKESIYRTARKVLDGNVYIPYSKLQ